MLIGMSLAVIVGFPVAGQAIVRLGSVRVMWIGGIAVTLAVNLPVLAPDPLLVVLGLVVLGASSATQDVAMNAHGVKVEHDLGRPIMSSLHAGWAFGGMAGAGFAAACTALDLDPRITVAISSAVLLSLALWSVRHVGEGSVAEGSDAPRFALPSRGVILIALLCLLVMVTEGAMADWGGLLLKQDYDASAALAALAYSFFTAGMTLGRVLGDRINHRIGPVALLRGGALLTGIPLAALLLIGHPASRPGRPVPRRPRRRERRAAHVQRRRPPAGRAAGPRHRRGVLDGLARLPGRPAADRLRGRRLVAAVGALGADPGRRRHVRAGRPRPRPSVSRPGRRERLTRAPAPAHPAGAQHQPPSCGCGALPTPSGSKRPATASTAPVGRPGPSGRTSHWSAPGTLASTTRPSGDGAASPSVAGLA